MNKIIHSSKVVKNIKINRYKVDEFITKFDKYIQTSKEPNSRDEYWMNTGLSNIPFLNEDELKYATKLVLKQGWILTSSDDNYHTTSYQMKPKA